MRWGALLGVAFASLWAQPAPAEEPAEQRFALEYQAAASCPDRAAFIAALRARAPNAVVASELSFGFRVNLQTRGTSTLFSLPDGATQREVRGESCEDAAASLAVIIAMLLEQELAQTAEPRAPTSPTPTPAPDSVAAPAPSPSAPRTPRPAAPRRGSEPSELELSVASGLAFESAVAPDPPLAATIGLESTLQHLRWGSPSVRLELVATSDGQHRTAAGSARFRLIAGRATGCVEPLRLRFGLHVRPCLALLLGRYSATGGADALNARQATQVWVSGGPAVRGDLHLWRGLSLDAYLGLTWLARHDRFIFQPSTLVYELPGLSLGGALGLSWRFH